MDETMPGVGVEVKIPGRETMNYYHEMCFDQVFPPDSNVEIVHQIGGHEVESPHEFAGITCDHCHRLLSENPQPFEM